MRLKKLTDHIAVLESKLQCQEQEARHLKEQNMGYCNQISNLTDELTAKCKRSKLLE
jgi:hypothetical protein